MVNVLLHRAVFVRRKSIRVVNRVAGPICDPFNIVNHCVRFLDLCPNQMQLKKLCANPLLTANSRGAVNNCVLVE